MQNKRNKFNAKKIKTKNYRINQTIFKTECKKKRIKYTK